MFHTAQTQWCLIRSSSNQHAQLQGLFEIVKLSVSLVQLEQLTKVDQGQMKGDNLHGRRKLEKWLNKSMRIQMTDGRTLIGIFLCTDKDRNVILGSCEEYLKPPGTTDPKEEPRILGLAMVPGCHIVSICVDEDRIPETSLAHTAMIS